ncbi:Polynucleotide 5'-triphosphatase [Caenorhabditis elegans]|uniref:Polynucleotide 5'-triphosphatase n=1 Tax=Caenorhabditis elegans TaxID=6239 RepID=A7LPJ2_CAEEL|nr:Polynucleotide 5'-triphosphatase [Caenorhabditis elegans]CAO82068.1 Polynucleotide 5'-triphosphatase [Caenorhabditis elegans]|eukprot:NP_001123004.1 Uncharacterized protein CELE_T05E12.9 [Caenorhabditis elegans]
MDPDVQCSVSSRDERLYAEMEEMRSPIKEAVDVFGLSGSTRIEITSPQTPDISMCLSEKVTSLEVHMNALKNRLVFMKNGMSKVYRNELFTYDLTKPKPTVIHRPSSKIQSFRKFLGLAVSESHVQRCNTRFREFKFKYIYSPVIGLIRAVKNEDGCRVERGKVYMFNVKDSRTPSYRESNAPAIVAITATKRQELPNLLYTYIDEENQLKIARKFKIDVTQFKNDSKRLQDYTFQDSFLGKVDFPREHQKSFLKIIEEQGLRGEIEIELIVGLYEDYVRRNRRIVENVIFLVTKLKSVNFTQKISIS